MPKKSAPQSGVLNARLLFAFALGFVGGLLAVSSFAATLSNGMTGSGANSTVDSVFVDQPAGPLSSHATATEAGSWAIVTSPNTSTTQGNVLTGVTCVTASDCWAVGYYFNSSSVRQTLIEHWDGTSWVIIPSPNSNTLLSTQDNFLYGVTCVAASDCWAVGYYVADSVTGTTTQTLIERWNGTSWTIVTSPNSSAPHNYLYGVTCASASDCWSVGYYYTGSDAQTLIERWDGTSWAIVASPNTSATQDNVLSAVTCLSASDCWAVGYYASSANQTLIERWNGTSWTIVTSPNASPTENNYLDDVTCVSASDCWAVGRSSAGAGAFKTLVERWNGTSWSIVPSPNASSVQYSFLTGVTCASASDCWAVGNYYTGAVYQTLIAQWDGTSWAIVTSPNNSAARTSYLYGVICASASDCWAVGYYSANTFGPSQTLIEKYTASAPPVQLSAAVSRKAHGSAGSFDLNLPQTGNPGIECRNGGTNDDYQIVLTFANPLTSVGGASVTSGTGSVSGSAIGADAHQYIVNLTGITNAQVVTVGLTNVSDSAGNSSSAVSASMGVLLGDTTANASVNSSDIAQTKSQSGQAISEANFRQDVTANGALNSSDIALVKSKSGTALP